MLGLIASHPQARDDDSYAKHIDVKNSSQNAGPSLICCDCHVIGAARGKQLLSLLCELSHKRKKSATIGTS